MKVIFDEKALDDLDNIFAWIAKDNRPAAERFVKRILEKVDLLELSALAEMGRPGLDPGTRELVEYPYIIVYEIDEDHGRIIVLTVVHGAQDRKPEK